MRSSMVPSVWALSLLLLLPPGTHERRILSFAFPIVLFFVTERRGKTLKNSNMRFPTFYARTFYYKTLRYYKRGNSSRFLTARAKTLRTRTANRLVEDSRFRGGSANIRDDRARARIARLRNPTALRRPRVNTSNSPSDHI